MRSDVKHSIKRARMDARSQHLSCAQDAMVLPENGDCFVEPVALLISLRWHLDKITFTY